MGMPGRKFDAGVGYRYGFNGKEKDTEGPVQYDYGFRIYDPRIVRFKSVDPLTNSYPGLTPYQFAGNSPITFMDLDGLELAWRNPVTGQIIAAGPVNLPIGTRQNGWILFAPPVNQTSSGTSSQPPIAKPTLQASSDILASVKAKQSQQIALKQFVPKQAPQNITTVSADNRTAYEREQSAEYAQQREQAKVIGQYMQTPEGQGGMALGLTMYSVARTPVTAYEHGSGAVDDIREGNYWSAAGNILLLGMDVVPFVKVPIKTPYGLASQSTTSEAMNVARSVHGGSTLYKIGTLGNSETFASQFWSTENPLEIGIEAFANKYGVPEANLKGDLFIQTGKLQPNSGFVTREARDLSGNITGGIEVVTNPGTVKLEAFSTIKR